MRMRAKSKHRLPVQTAGIPLPIKISRYLFTTGEDGYLKQWDIQNRKLFKSYGKIHTDWISQMALTNEFLITCTGNWGYVKLFRWVPAKDRMACNNGHFEVEVLFDFGRQMVGGVKGLALDQSKQNMFLSGTSGEFAEYSLKDRQIVQELAGFHPGGLLICSV